jgi:hypothetical protein
MLIRSRTAILTTGIFATLFTLLFISLATASEETTSTTITISAGEIDRENVPVIYNLPEELRDAETLILSATDAFSVRPIPTQRTPDGTQLVWMLQRPLVAGATRSYTLIASDAAEQESDRAPAVRLIQTDEEISIKVDDLPVLAYQIAVRRPPEDAPAYYARSGFIHPLMTPSGKILTDDFPPDHFHQHAIFFAWVNTTFQDRRVDFWNQAKEEGNVRHVEVIDRCQGNVFAEFTVKLAHEAFNEDGPTTRALDETWTVRVYRRTDGFLVDFTSRQQCASESPLLMNEYHYGGMGFRGARHWTDLDQAGFLTSEGCSRKDGNHTRPNWVDAFGPFDDGPAGTTILCHPDNFRSPQSVRLHPSMPYFCFAPCVDGEFSISPGNVHESHYRFLTHDGPVDPAVADRHWEDYAKPLIVE